MKHTVYFSNTYTTYMFDNTIPLRTMKALRGIVSVWIEYKDRMHVVGKLEYHSSYNYM